MEKSEKREEEEKKETKKKKEEEGTRKRDRKLPRYSHKQRVLYRLYIVYIGLLATSYTPDEKGRSMKL